MKKSLFLMAAASALMLTACTSEDDVLQSAAPQKSEAKALGFDVYMPQAVTRAGEPKGVMTTEKLKTADKGFGVFAMYTGTANYAAETFKPNFMFNEHISWNGGWTYSPLKYWPNETTNDSQTPTNATMADLEKLSFFAYAPYVDLSPSDPGTGTMTVNTTGPVTKPAYVGASAQESGILSYTKEDRIDDPLVAWGATTDLDNHVDLLWGVAPAGMDYTAVNGENVPTTFGKPLVNLVKPDKDLKIKFLFQHALSRMSISVVSAIDQIAAGDDGDKFDPNQTRVLIENVEIFGDFSTSGVLNLNNGDNANVANWVQTSIVKSTSGPSGSGTPLITLDQGTTAAQNGYLSPDLRYDASQIALITGTEAAGVYSGGDASKFEGLNRGVLPSEAVLLSGDADPGKAEPGTPTYQYGKVYYISNGDVANKSYVTAKAYTEKTAGYKVYSKSKEGNYELVYTGTGSGDGFAVDGTTPYYTLSGADAVVDAVLSAPTGTDPSKYYWTKNPTTEVFEIHELKVGDTDVAASTYYTLAETPVAATYASGTYWSGLIPRYFMFAPSKTGESTTVGVKITYHVVTKDTKLNGNISDVTNIVTKTIPLTMESGKSYNLKLILGLTSVKLDATVGEWQVGDDAEIWLPQNVE